MTDQLKVISYGNDPSGNENVQIGGLRSVLIKKEPFWDYLRRKGVDRGSFMRSSLRNREETYLTWKFGTHGYECNSDVESTDIYLTNRIKSFGLENLNPDSKWYWEKEIKFQDKCFQLKKELGLVADYKKQIEEHKEQHISEILKDKPATRADWDE